MSQTKAQLIDPVDGTIVNADINASAAIAGTKIEPNFGSQNINTSGSAAVGNITISNVNPKIFLTDTNNDSDFSLKNNNGVFSITDQTNSADRLAIDSNGNVGIKGGTALHELHVFGTATTLAITDNAASSTSVSTILFRNRDGNSNFRDVATIEGESAGNGGYGVIAFNTAFDNNLYERMRVDKDGRVKIGTTSNTPAASDVAGIVFGDNTAGTAKVGVASFCADGAAPLLLTRLTSDGNILGIADDNGTKALLRVNSNDFEVTAIEDLRLATGSGHTERIRLTNAGNLGIGTTSPSTTLHINAAGSSTQMRIENSNADFLIQAGDAGDDGLHFYDLDNSAYRMMISNNGNVGIGTTSPAVKLDVTGKIHASTSIGIRTTSPQQNLHVHQTDSGASVIKFTNSTTTIGSGNGFDIGLDSSEQGFLHVRENKPLVFEINSSERMRLTSNGRLGIGTSSPDHLFEVEDNNSSIATSRTGANAQLLFKSNSVAQCGQIQVSESTGGGIMQFFTKTTAGTITEHLRINTDGKLKIDVDDSNTSRVNATHLQIQNSNFGASACAGIMLAASNGANSEFNIVAQKHSSGTGADFHLDNGTDAMIQISGDNGDIKFGKAGSMIDTFTPGLNNNTVGLGLEPRNGSIFLSRSSGAALYVNTNTDGSQLATFRRGGNEQGKIIAHSSSVSYETTSDYRVKENAVAISDGITRLKQLKPYRFNFKSNPSEILDGFFAHEAQAVVPECASGTKDQMKSIYYKEEDTIPEGKKIGDFKEYSTTEPEYQGIDQSKIVPLLTAALQEEIAKREALEARVAAVEAA